jgi:hypothetical protein
MRTFTLGEQRWIVAKVEPLMARADALGPSFAACGAAGTNLGFARVSESDGCGLNPAGFWLAVGRCPTKRGWLRNRDAKRGKWGRVGDG